MTGAHLHGQHALPKPYDEPSGSDSRRGRSLDLPVQTTPAFKAALPTIPQDPRSAGASIRSFRAFRSFRSIGPSESSSDAPARPAHPPYVSTAEVLDTNVEDIQEEDQAALTADPTGGSPAPAAPSSLEVVPPLPDTPLRKKSSQALRRRASPPLSSPLNEDGQPRAAQEPPTNPLADGIRRISSAPRLRGDAQRKSRPKPPNPPGTGEAVRGDGSEQAAYSPALRPRGLITPHSTSDWPLRLSGSNRSLPSVNRQTEHDSQPVRDSSDTTMPSDVNSKLQEYHDALRESYRSYLTNASSSCIDASGTERSSVVTKSTSYSDLYDGYYSQQHVEDEGMTVEDAITMYADGFTDGPLTEAAEDIPNKPHLYQDARSPSFTNADVKSDSYMEHSEAGEDSGGDVAREELPKPLPFPPAARHVRSSTRNLSGETHPPAPEPKLPKPVPRDCYGFKKSSQYFTPDQYDAWNGSYTLHLERRRKKWLHLMKQYGLTTESPIRFPPKTDKVKRYVRKGIPPEWRGAAWFWYAGGPSRLAQNPGLYWELVEQVDGDRLGDTDREHIERDLNRTFPDNSRFKPDASVDYDNAETAGGSVHPPNSYVEPETPIVRALRRVLQAFAIHNPSIGYCQSLNFLAGLLLLFLDEDEEKAFVMLNIITNEHLPGTHGRVLEANVDVGVLMSCIKESMPAVWAKIDDTDETSHANGASAARLPTVSLATTAWFMSCFVGNLPIETVLRVWDSLFYEGSKTLFRIALAIFKVGEPDIRAVTDHMEIFQVVQTIPRKLVDASALMETCFRRRNGFGHLSQESIDRRRAERRRLLADDRAGRGGEGEKRRNPMRRVASRARFKRSMSRKRLKGQD